MKRVVLVRTIGPRNAGAALRAVANFGPAELWFVAQQRASLLVHPDFSAMAHGVENVRDKIRVAATLDEALADCTHSVAFSARARGSRKRIDWREHVAATRALCDDREQIVALVFGAEENGLTAEETDRCKELVFLPTSAEHTSINLATAVGIVLYTLYGEHGMHQKERGAHLVSERALRFLRAHLKEVLGARVAMTPAAKRDIEASVDRIFTRVPVESRDARAWHMMMRALGSQLEPRDFGIGGQPRELRRDEALERGKEDGGRGIEQ
jgi:tRNA/rRNA methyltransferase/tRNA (cytidine32/uridine32-2'-O)-methyltransferase